MSSRKDMARTSKVSLPVALMHGCGNRFILIDERSSSSPIPPHQLSRFVQDISAKYDGEGFDVDSVLFLFSFPLVVLAVFVLNCYAISDNEALSCKIDISKYSIALS
jgi:hypothetical protein